MIDENIYELMKHSFGGAVHTIYVPSLNRSVPFKEPTVRETKMVSKIVISNKDSQSIIYATTLALIKGLCVEKSFDQYALTEFDRLTILAHLFANNFLSKQLGIRCPDGKCGHSFVHVVKHGDLIKAMDNMDVTDIVFENDNENGSISVKINYPTTWQYLNFLEFVDGENEKAQQSSEQHSDRYSELNSAFSEIDAMRTGSQNAKPMADINDVHIANMINKKRVNAKNASRTSSAAGNIDISSINGRYSILDTGDLYIREINYTIAGNNDKNRIVFDNEITFSDRERILGMFPMSFFTKKDGLSLFDFAATELSRRMHTCVPSIKCPKCGNDVGNKIGLQDFFMRG